MRPFHRLQNVRCDVMAMVVGAFLSASALGQVASPRPAAPPGPGPAAAAPTPAHPLAPDTASAVERLNWAIGVLNGNFELLKDARFSEALLKETPMPELERAMREFAEASGGVKVLRVTPGEGPRATAWIRTASKNEDWALTIETQLAEPHAISRLTLGPAPVRRNPDYPGWAVFDADMKLWNARQGRSASFACYEFLPSGELRLVHEYEASRRMSIGTTAMVLVAGAVAEAVSDGAMKWDQPLAIAPELKSVPDSKFGQGVTGAEHPVSAYVRAMLADADNTAADHLIAILGRERVERERDRWAEDAGGPPDPFLTTLEFHKIKCAPTADVLRHYALEEPAGRRLLLEGEVARSRVMFELMAAWMQPQYIDKIGWFSSAADLAKEMARLRALARDAGMEPLDDALKPVSVPKGLMLDGPEWESGWLVSGGEPGVFGAAWTLGRKDGRVFCMSLVTNDEKGPIEPLEVQPMITAIGRLLAREGAAPKPLPAPARP